MQVAVVEPVGRLDRADQLAVLDGVVGAARVRLVAGGESELVEQLGKKALL